MLERKISGNAFPCNGVAHSIFVFEINQKLELQQKMNLLGNLCIGVLRFFVSSKATPLPIIYQVHFVQAVCHAL